MDTPNFTLKDFLQEEKKPIINVSNDSVKFLFYTGIEQFLMAVSSIISAAIFAENNPPPGFTSRFSRCFTKPVLGTILNEYILKLINYSSNPSLIQIQKYFEETEKKSNWLGKCISLRNSYIHLKEKDVNEILEEGKKLLSQAPDFSLLGHFNVSGQTVYWNLEEQKLSISPFIILKNSRFLIFREFEKPESLVFDKKERINEDLFGQAFRLLREKDLMLEEPSKEEIHKRVKPIGQRTEQEYWWFDKILKAKFAINIIDKELLPNLLGYISKSVPSIIVGIKDDNILSKAITEHLGLAEIKNRSDFISTFKESNLAIGLSANDLNIKQFSSLIEWIISLYHDHPSLSLRFYIERSTDKIRIDQEKLSGRLPDDLNMVLGGPNGPFRDDLTEVIWSTNTKRKFMFF